jgi:23S rRNA pseudouridine2604 synthase
MNQDSVRLAKRLAEQMSCSRRQAEQYIEGGWVRVDGRVVEEPQYRVLHEKIEIDPNANLMGLTDATLVLNKPPGVEVGLNQEQGQENRHAERLNERLGARTAIGLITVASHMKHDPTAQKLLKRHLLRLSCPVPLETGASGLLVFTQDWRVARKLTEDASMMEHEVIVEVVSEVSDDTLRRLNHKLSSRGDPLPAFKVSINSSGDGKSKLRFAIKGSHPGLIAWVCERAGVQMLGMKRIRLGRVALSTLALGQWRFLQEGERF